MNHLPRLCLCPPECGLRPPWANRGTTLPTGDLTERRPRGGRDPRSGQACRAANARSRPRPGFGGQGCTHFRSARLGLWPHTASLRTPSAPSAPTVPFGRKPGNPAHHSRKLPSKPAAGHRQPPLAPPQAPRRPRQDGGSGRRGPPVIRNDGKENARGHRSTWCGREQEKQVLGSARRPPTPRTAQRFCTACGFTGSGRACLRGEGPAGREIDSRVCRPALPRARLEGSPWSSQIPRPQAPRKH